MADLPTGIFKAFDRHGRWRGYRVFVSVADPHHPKGRLVSKRFPHHAPVKEMTQWRESQRVGARQRRVTAATTVPTGTGFIAEANEYLRLVQTMPAFKDRRRDILAWVAVLGEQSTDSITPAQIRHQRDVWRLIGPKRVLEKVKGQKARWVLRDLPLSASSVNHRLRALENFFTVTRGKHAPNPVREVDECDEPELTPKGQTFALGYEVLAFMPDRTVPKKGGTWEAGSLARIRYETMLVTGLPPKQLAALKPEHVDWSVPSFTPPPRQKGRKARRQRARQRPKARPLMPAALPILRVFFAMQANKQFSQTSLGRSVKRAIRAANTVRAERGLEPIPETLRPYDLTRHTFGTEVYRLTENLKVVQDLMGHADIKQSERYALAAVQDHQASAALRLSSVLRRATRVVRNGGKVSPRQTSTTVRTQRTASSRKHQ